MHIGHQNIYHTYHIIDGHLSYPQCTIQAGILHEPDIWYHWDISNFTSILYAAYSRKCLRSCDKHVLFVDY